jgi:hypothetical protein
MSNHSPRTVLLNLFTIGLTTWQVAEGSQFIDRSLQQEWEERKAGNGVLQGN